jgi:hypothetical protein
MLDLNGGIVFVEILSYASLELFIFMILKVPVYKY